MRTSTPQDCSTSMPLIRVNRGRQGGYLATPKFNRFMKIAITKGELET